MANMNKDQPERSDRDVFVGRFRHPAYWMVVAAVAMVTLVFLRLWQ